MIKAQGEELAAEKAKNAEAESKAAADAAAAAAATSNSTAANGNGLAPLVAGDGDGAEASNAGGDLAQQFEAKVGEQVAAGRSRLDAVHAVASANPDLHKAYIASTNATTGSVGRQVADKISMQCEDDK